jgi:hypothetical protein
MVDNQPCSLNLIYILLVTFETVLLSNIVNSNREAVKQGGLVRLILLQSFFLTLHLQLFRVWSVEDVLLDTTICMCVCDLHGCLSLAIELCVRSQL